YLLQDGDGQVASAHSVSAGLDCPGVGAEHAWLRASGRVSYDAVDDVSALAAFQRLAQLERILPALETLHAIACTDSAKGDRDADEIVRLCLSGRGDKDVAHVAWMLEGGT